MRLTAFVGLLVFTLVLGCVALETTPAGGRSACADFRGLGDDAAAGIVTDVELRDRMASVQSWASTAEPDIRDAATMALRGLTLNDMGVYADGVAALFKACNAHGY